MTTTIQPNAFVTLDYVLKDEDGELLDSSTGEDGEPIEYVHGYGMLVPGLEVAIVGLAAGESKDVVVPAEEGFGEYDDELLVEVERAELPDPKKVELGDELVAESPDGEEIPMRVIEILDDAVVMDANHPLAGVTLHYSVTVKSVRAATEAEIAKAAADFDEAEEAVNGPAPKAADAPDLLTIGRKKPLTN